MRIKRCVAIAFAVMLSFCSISAMAVENDTTLVTEDTSALANDSYVQIYEHDPRINAKAMEDIVVNPKAIFGFSPDPNSTRLGGYADAIDWSDAAAVSKAQADRVEYLSDYDKMHKRWKELEKEGKNIESIAREISAMRNQIRIDSYKNDPDGLALLKKSNLDTYGNEDGPTPDSLYEKYGSWEKVLNKCFASNSGMDACLGLYEVQYQYNLKVGTVVENPLVEYTVKAGDSLSKIAEKYYGNKAGWTNIYNANKDSISNPNIIHVGEKFVIPVK